LNEGLKVSKSALLIAEHLSWCADDNLILDDISFAIEQGSFTGILGPNGAGKSSLLRCLYRFVAPEQGVVSFECDDIWQLNANDYAKSVAVVLQETPSHFNLTVHDVVALGLIPHKGLFARADKADDEKILQAISQVGLVHKSQQNFEHLSGGEKQRALIARAIVQSPRLLIMDEPTSHLDVRYQIQIMELAKSLGITVIASFHDLNLASAMCDNLLVLNQGKLVCQGTPKEVLTKEMLSDVFGVCAHISEHHQHKVPHISYYYGYIQDEHGEHRV
jgi:iron complex transport system ATP-binding protein